MAAEDRDGVPRAQAAACLCVLCGLPASGKSTLASAVLGSAAQHGWKAAVVPYDELIPQQAFHPRAEQEMHTDWKLHRQVVLQHIEQFLKTRDAETELTNGCQINSAAWEHCVGVLRQSQALETDRTPLLFLLDDNFYYPSMRYEVHQLARKYSLGFCQVYLHCDLESCISRNQNRPQPIPTEVILDMVKRLESPDPQKNTWEKPSISLNTTNQLSTCDIQKATQLISSALENPLSPVDDNAEQKEADRLKCATSVVHQADQACRRLISEAMSVARENRVSPSHMRSLAARLNESKATFLRNLREQLLQETSLAREDDVDVERVVKRAVDVFDHGRKEILMGIVNNHELLI